MSYLILTHTLYHKFKKYGYNNQQASRFNIEYSKRIKKCKTHKSYTQENSLSDRRMDGINIYFSSIIDLLKKIEEEGKKRTHRQKTGDTHYDNPHEYIAFQIHVKKEEKHRTDARKKN